MARLGYSTGTKRSRRRRRRSTSWYPTSGAWPFTVAAASIAPRISTTTLTSVPAAATWRRWSRWSGCWYRRWIWTSATSSRDGNIGTIPELLVKFRSGKERWDQMIGSLKGKASMIISNINHKLVRTAWKWNVPVQDGAYQSDRVAIGYCYNLANRHYLLTNLIFLLMLVST